MSHKEETIIALATPPGVGAIGVIRVCGEDAFQMTDKFFAGKTKIEQAKSHTIHYGKFRDASGSVVDDVVISVFRNPHSYTGENSVEISFHGNPLIAEKIIRCYLKEGIRIAEPGEFTKRAFLNNRIDLSQAEAVSEIISSRSDASLRGARNQLDGLLSSKITSLRNSLIEVSSLVELELDFAEEDLEFIERKALVSKISIVKKEVEDLLATYKVGRVIRDGVNLAIVGQPNVGKSSLLNYLLKESRAIVSEIPGTTRDIIREEIVIDGILFKIFDTAGIRLTEDPVEKEGVQRSREAIRQADLVVFLTDAEVGFSDELFAELLTLSTKEKVICALNKIDVSRESSNKYDCRLSAKTGEGVAALISLIQSKSVVSKNYTERSAIITSARHFESLSNSLSHLNNSLTSIEGHMSGEYISVDLRNAENSLSEIIGIVTTDDILNNIFQKFCIGK